MSTHTEKGASLKTYFSVFALLMLMTALTVWVSFVDLGRFNDLIALSIAGFKATLVILYFMHVRYSEKLIWVMIGTGFYFLTILLLITLADYVARQTIG